MNTIQDTLSTLMPGGRALAEIIMEEAREMFKNIGKVNPAMFAYTGGREKPFQIEDIEILDDDTKPIVWAKLRRWREQYLIVAFVAEVWMAQQKGKEWDGVMPRDNPNKTEHVLVHIWQGSRVISFCSDITRNPSAMGEWKVVFDSLFTKDKNSKLEGAMMEGNSCRMETN